MTTSNEHNNAPAVPQGWTDADSDAARLALELECLLMDTKDLSVVSKWWGSANDALELHRQRLAATPAPAPAQEVGLTEGEIQALGHRIATTYRHDEDGFRRQYAFNIYTLVDFANAIIAALRAKGGK